jgi:hypothetical protein
MDICKCPKIDPTLKNIIPVSCIPNICTENNFPEPIKGFAIK